MLLLEGADELADGCQLVALQIVHDTRIDLHTDERIIEQRCTDTDRCRAGKQKFEGIVCRSNAALADNRHVVILCNLIYLPGLQ